MELLSIISIALLCAYALSLVNITNFIKSLFEYFEKLFNSIQEKVVRHSVEYLEFSNNEKASAISYSIIWALVVVFEFFRFKNYFANAAKVSDTYTIWGLTINISAIINLVIVLVSIAIGHMTFKSIKKSPKTSLDKISMILLILLLFTLSCIFAYVSLEMSEDAFSKTSIKIFFATITFLLPIFGGLLYKYFEVIVIVLFYYFVNIFKIISHGIQETIDYVEKLINIIASPIHFLIELFLKLISKTTFYEKLTATLEIVRKRLFK